MAESPRASPPLRRVLSPASALLVTVGAMIGSGIFATPHDAARLVPHAPTLLALWTVGGVLALLGAYSFVELAAAIPETGGLYVYLRRAFGPFAAFAFGWAMFAVLVPSSAGFFAQVASRYAAGALGVGTTAEHGLTVAILAGIVLANLRGVRAGAAVQNAATVLKYVGVLALACAGVLLAPAGVPARLPGAPSPLASPSIAVLLAALVPVLWAYDGWIDVTSIAGEVRDPVRQLPRSLARGTALVTALYLLANAGYLRALGVDGLVRAEAPAAVVATRVLGSSGGSVAAVLVTIATFGGCAVALLTGSRVVYAVARDGLFFEVFGRTSRAAVPAAAVLGSGVLAAAYVFSPLGHLGEVFVIGAWPFYAAGALATIALRWREPELRRPVRTPLYPFVPLLFAASALAVVGGYAITSPRQTLASFALLALAVPLYVLRRRALNRAGRAVRAGGGSPPDRPRVEESEG